MSLYDTRDSCGSNIMLYYICMTTATLELYNALIEAGAKAFITRAEAQTTLATKEDLHVQTRWFVGLLIAQAAVIVALIELI